MEPTLLASFCGEAAIDVRGAGHDSDDSGITYTLDADTTTNQVRNDVHSSFSPRSRRRAERTLGPVTEISRDEHSITVACGTPAIRFTFLDDDIFRVRLAAEGDFPPLRSYALDPQRSWPGPQELRLTHLTDKVIVETTDLQLHLHRKPCRLVVYDTGGRLLHEDLNGPYRTAAEDDHRVGYSKKLHPRETLLGLGDKPVEVNRRGHSFEHWNSDTPNYVRGDDPLYKTFPVLVGLLDDRAYGLFFDNPGRSRFDLGADDSSELRYDAAEGSLCYYFYHGQTPLDVVRQYSRLTGTMPMLPRWALGYHQCRHSYHPESDVREVAQTLRDRRIPCDAIYLDIYYMDGFRVFTWDPEEFPAPQRMIEDLREDGFRTVTILDPGVKADDRFPVARDGLDRGVFCTYPSGKPFIGNVWPGPCYFPDFLCSDAREWWGEHLRHYTDAGVAGIWCDMNEPSVFAAPRQSPHARKMTSEEFHTTIDPEVLHGCEDPHSTHREVHNVYGLEMLEATYEGLRQRKPTRRPFAITRAAYAGAQRYGTAWTGDNASTWDHLKLTIEQCTSLNVSGMPFVGSDVGGFLGEARGDLMARWIQLGAFIPFFRNHSAIEVPRQEVWRFGQKIEDICRNYIELRYRLLPYFYTQMHRAASDGTPMIRPMLLMHPTDPTLRADELYGFYAGNDLLVYPVVEPDTQYREIYLPEGRWYNFWTGRVFDGPVRLQVYAPLDHLPLFVRGGAVLPLQPVVQHTNERPIHTLTLRVYPSDTGVGDQLYEDAGDGWDFQDGDYFHCRFDGAIGAAEFRLNAEISGNFTPSWDRWMVLLYDPPDAPSTVESGGNPVPFDQEERFLQTTVDVGENLVVSAD